MDGAQTPLKSTFVTVVAWIFLVLSGFSSFIGVFQNIMIWFFFPRDQMSGAMNDPAVAKATPAAMRLLFGNIHFFFLGFFLMSLFTFITSVGLLRRHEWARKAFIALMFLGIIWNFGSVAFQYTMMGEMTGSLKVPADMRTMFVMIEVLTVFAAVAFSALFGWIAKRLMSPAIRAEFVS